MGAARAAARCGDFSGIGCTRVGEAAVCTIGLGRADEGRSIRVAGLTDLVGRAGLYPLRATVAILVALAYGFIWVVIFGYVWSVRSRLTRVERELETVSRRVPARK